MTNATARSSRHQPRHGMLTEHDREQQEQVED
jgi:hypothetical protein